ncbi:ACP S-malonyltransferase [Streptomyces antimycoticus]|uniref:ACP S-malonyltransferase n=1 Tax=Streptomyces antimycoticus TaxID=68175 RepID=UPI003691AAAE
MTEPQATEPQIAEAQTAQAQTTEPRATESQPGRTAFVFPGMGPFRFTDVGEFLLTNPHARRRLAIADEVVGYSVFDRYRQSDGDEEGQYAAHTQIAFLTVCLSLADWAEETLGEKPELCAGPSFGQRAAVTYAGSLPFEETVRLTAELARCEEEYFAQEHREAVTHCVIHTPEESLRKALGELDDEGEWHDVSGHIDQGFYLVSLREPVLDRFKKRIGDLGGYNMYTMWPPVHAPSFGDLRRKAEEEVFGGFELADPELPVVSDQNGALLTEAEGVRTMLLDTFNCPIRWPDMVETMREQGITKVCISGPDNLFGRVNSTGENFEVLAIDARKAMRPRVRQRSARRARR